MLVISTAIVRMRALAQQAWGFDSSALFASPDGACSGRGQSVVPLSARPRAANRMESVGSESKQAY